VDDLLGENSLISASGDASLQGKGIKRRQERTQLRKDKGDV
jgi:hypothetical protein